MGVSIAPIQAKPWFSARIRENIVGAKKREIVAWFRKYLLVISMSHRIIHFKCWMKSILDCPICPPNAPRFASVPLEEPSRKKRKRKSKDSSIATNVDGDQSLAIDDDNSLSAAISYVEGLGSDLEGYLNDTQDLSADPRGKSPQTSTQQNQLALKDHLTDLQCGDWIAYQSPVSIFLDMSNHIELKFAWHAVF